jgi:hypothetical protein
MSRSGDSSGAARGGGSGGSGPNLAAVHDRLRAILAPHRDRLHVAADGPGGLTLELPGYEGTPWGYAAGTRLGKRYVSYYLMAVYGEPALLDGMSPALRRRMQGKSCFNFTRVDEPILAELATLTERSIARQPAIVEAALASRPRR